LAGTYGMPRDTKNPHSPQVNDNMQRLRMDNSFLVVAVVDGPLQN